MFWVHREGTSDKVGVRELSSKEEQPEEEDTVEKECSIKKDCMYKGLNMGPDYGECLERPEVKLDTNNGEDEHEKRIL